MGEGERGWSLVKLLLLAEGLRVMDRGWHLCVALTLTLTLIARVEELVQFGQVDPTTGERVRE